MSCGMNCGMCGRLIKMIASGGSRGLTKFQGKCLNGCSLHKSYFIGNSLVSSPYWVPALSFLRREVPVQRRAKEDDQITANPNSRCLFQKIAHLPEVIQRVAQHQCTPEFSLLTIHELIESECVDCQQFLLVMYQFVCMFYLQYDSASSRSLFCLETLDPTLLYGLRGG